MDGVWSEILCGEVAWMPLRAQWGSLDRVTQDGNKQGGRCPFDKYRTGGCQAAADPRSRNLPALKQETLVEDKLEMRLDITDRCRCWHRSRWPRRMSCSIGAPVYVVAGLVMQILQSLDTQRSFCAGL
jgi:hypothetical protein